MREKRMEYVIPSQMHTSRPRPCCSVGWFGGVPRSYEYCGKFADFTDKWTFISWKGQATFFSGVMIYVVLLSSMTAAIQATPSPLDSGFNPLFGLLGDDMPLFSKTMKMDQLKRQFLPAANFFCCRESSPAPGPTRGRVLERKWHAGPKTRGWFLVGMPSTPHCPVTCFMQALSQFEETNCASSVSIKTSVP